VLAKRSTVKEKQHCLPFIDRAHHSRAAAVVRRRHTNNIEEEEEEEEEQRGKMEKKNKQSYSFPFLTITKKRGDIIR
jgi:hypothetical protein